jgi:hypothetical protein
MKSVFILLIFSICIIASVTAQELNMDMEDVDAYAQPVMWRLGHNPNQTIVYRMMADPDIKHTGRYSLKITTNSNRAEFGSCFMQIPLELKGKSVTLKGFVKTENAGYGSLFLVLCDDSGMTIRSDIMKNSGKALTGTNDWKELSITLPNSDDVKKINFGGLLSGQGTVWIDDLTLLVDDIKIVKAPVLSPYIIDQKTGEKRKF